MKPAAAPSNASSLPEAVRIRPCSLLVLVVDDFPGNREMYAECLRRSGYRVAEAGNGLEAVEQALELLPGLILMDLSLPGIDGWEATRRLKLDARTSTIPVIAVTGHSAAGHSEGAMDMGFDGFLTKPCLPDRLVAEVARILAVRGTAIPDGSR